MNQVLGNVFDAYNFAIHKNGDKRTQNWYLVYNPWIPISTLAIYIYFCYNAKKLTSNLPTYSLKTVILVYNLLMLLLNVYMTYEFFHVAKKDHYGWSCQPVDYSYSESALRMASVCWVYYISKYAELVETVIFALRKKYNQISFLHVYHHVTMLALWWSVSKWTPGGQSYIFGGINSFVHFVMYTYYGLSSLGPKVRKFLWWKRYITMLQLSQFIVLFVYCIQNIYQKCDFPKILCLSMIGYSISLMILFLNFFSNAYLKKSSEVATTKSFADKINSGSNKTKEESFAWIRSLDSKNKQN